MISYDVALQHATSPLGMLGIQLKETQPQLVQIIMSVA
jgi:hypothetical protein